MANTGRPTKLTPELTDAIVSDIESGNYVETAAQANGIDVKTYYNWINWGAEGREPYAAFFQAVACARARAEVELLRRVAAGDDKGTGFGEARGAAFILERTRPKRFAQRVNVKVQDELERMLDIAQGILSAEDFGRLLEAIAADDSEGEAHSASDAADLH